MTLPDFGVDFIRDALKHSESYLLVARKNAKSAVIAVYLLARLVGPLRQAGYRAGVCSINREKSAELWMQMQQIAEASGLQGVRFLKAPRSVEGPSGRADFLSADKNVGHASGFDDSIVDELGLLKERNRELVAGMRSATSAKGGRFIALSIVGAAPFTKEAVDRRDDPAVCVHLYQADADAALDDEAQWLKANPTLGTVKQWQHMRDESRNAIAIPAYQSYFRAHELNVPVDPGQEMIVTLNDWRKVVVPEDDMPPRKGGVVIGFDCGGSASMTCAVLIWPESGRMEVYGAYGDNPSLADRSVADGCRGLYEEMHRRGELTVYSGRTTPVSAFLAGIAARVSDQHVIAVGADRVRSGAALDGVERAGAHWFVTWRGRGRGTDGLGDVVAFQMLVLGEKVRCRESVMMESAIGESKVAYDHNSNAYVDKSTSRGRIDALQAGIIACGLAERLMDKPERKLRSFTL